MLTYLKNKVKTFSINSGSSNGGYTPPYKVYSAILNQSATNSPVSTVLDNNLGNIVWTRDAAGEYTGTLTGAFTLNKTLILIGGVSGQGDSIITDSDLDHIFISTSNALNTLVDDLLSNTSIEIRVYN